jgi:hypothetical protein
MTTTKFPFTIRLTVFPKDADKRNLFLASYVIETIINNEKEERKYYESVNHEQNQTIETNYGRVFYTTGDQDGNFKVGNLFGVEQATGIVTLSATQFGLSGLETLSLGGIAVGGSSVVISQFSTDGTLAANSDNILPTQKAIKTYITGRLSQGGSNTFTGNIIAGNLSIGNPNYISNQIPVGISGSSINMPRLTVFKGPGGNSGWAGSGAALQMFVAGFAHRGNVAPGGTVQAGR